MTAVISVENLSKSYRLGQIGTGTFAHDLNVWWAKLRGNPNPMLRIGETDHGNRDGEDIWALKDVSFTVQQGEVLGIIGRNGAGKSTLLKILSRVTAPTSGKVKVKGRIASLLEVGTGFHPELTGRENIYLNGAILGMSRQEVTRKFDEIVDFAEVEKFIDTPVKRYSSGMYVRLAFAVAAHLEPEILVVDEVLAVGDAEFQKKCLGKIGDVAKKGRTVLFVSHNMAAVKRLCQHSVLLDTGKISMAGETMKVMNKYLSFEDDNFSYSAPSNLETPVNLRKIELQGENGKQIKGAIEINNSFFIYLEYEINRPIQGAHAFLRIHLSDGETLLSTGDTDTKPVRIGRREPGHYKCLLKISPNILNVGSYSITWSFGVPFQVNYDVKFHVLRFNIVENHSSRSHYIHRSRPGSLAVDIEWKYFYETNHIDPIGI